MYYGAGGEFFMFGCGLSMITRKIEAGERERESRLPLLMVEGEQQIK